MRLVKIKNKYLFNSDNPEQVHTYAVYYDKKNKSNRAIGLTHLYEKDNTRFSQLRRNMLMKEKFKEFETPTGVKNSYFSKNRFGNKIDLTDTRYVVKVGRRYLPKSQSERIKKFAKHNNNK